MRTVRIIQKPCISIESALMWIIRLTKKKYGHPKSLTDKHERQAQPKDKI